MKTVECGPDPVSWFGQGVWPTCLCGFGPKNNTSLILHWEARGFKVVDNGGVLVRVSVCSECGHEPGEHDDLGDGCTKCKCMLTVDEAEYGRDDSIDDAINTVLWEDGVAKGETWATGEEPKMHEEEPFEGCPECRNDTVVTDSDGISRCDYCGWRD